MCDPSYLDWFQQHHIAMHGVEPALVAEGWRGVVATQHLAPGHVVMTIPEQLLMSVVSAKRDPQLSPVLQQHQLNSHQILAVHLIHEASKGPASFWHPYIQQLPRHYTTWTNWGPEAVEALQLQHAQEAAAAAISKARQEWTSARPVLQQLGVDKKWCSWRAWQWASSAVMSRTMYHPADPPCGCLTPLGDLHNYAPPPAPYTPDLAHGLQQLLEEQGQNHQQQQQQQQRYLQQQQRKVQMVGQVQPCACQTEDAGLGDQEPHCQVQHPQQHSQQQQQQQQQGKDDDHGIARDSVVLHQQQGQNVTQQSSQDTFVGGRGSTSTSCGMTHDSSDRNGAMSSTTTVNPSSRPCDSCESSNSSSSNGTVGQQQHGEAASIQQGPVAESAAVTTRAAAAAPSPLADTAPHEAPDSAAISGDGHFDEHQGCYKIVARRSYQPGDQVFLCYGRHTNLELLELYGFLLPGNPHDTALLPVELLQEHLQQAYHHQQQQQQRQAGVVGSPWRRQQQQKQQQVCLDVPAADCCVHVNGQPSWQLLSALRCAAACPAEAKALGYKALNGDPISIGSELTALQALASACRAQLAALPTTTDEDQLLLQQLLGNVNGTGAATEKRECSNEGQDCQQPTLTQGKNLQQGGSHHHQQQQQLTECLCLAIQWRHTYKAAISHCAECCEEVLQGASQHPSRS